MEKDTRQKKKRGSHNPFSQLEGRHSYEPISDKTSDEGELIIDEDTKWIPTCKTTMETITEKDFMNHEGYLYFLKLEEHFDLAKKLAKEEAEEQGEIYEPFPPRRRCMECQVMDLTSHLDILDYVSIEDVFKDTNGEGA